MNDNLDSVYTSQARIATQCGYYSSIQDGLNQIGIKIDMYRQEHRFSPAMPVFRRFDV